MLAHQATGDGERLREIGQQLEELDFATVWLADHIVLPTRQTPFPYEQRRDRAPALVEPLVTLSYLAACTTRIQLGVAVLVLPQREPILATKQIATLDCLARGRFHLGIGVGWLQTEFEVLGADFRSRGARTDSAHALMTSLWTGETCHKGELEFDVRPLPYDRRIQIVIGGESDGAMRRLARFGSAYFPYTPSYDALARSVERADRALMRVGRSINDVELIGLMTKEPKWADRLASLGFRELVVRIGPTLNVADIRSELANRGE